jgi:hypothetical protein
MMQSVWKKPVICIFRERSINPESDPIVVIKARQLTVTTENNSKYFGTINDFFTLMGDTDQLTTEEGKTDHYVMCWFDDTEPDMTQDLRRLRGVHFNTNITCNINEKTQKRTYNATFNAEQAKLS